VARHGDGEADALADGSRVDLELNFHVSRQAMLFHQASVMHLSS